MKPIDILLASENISIRYRTLTELLDAEKSDREVVELKAAIPETKLVKDIFSKMHPDGYWEQKNPRTMKVVGDGVEYGSFATTHFVLSYLMELGLDNSHPLVSKAAKRYLGLQKEDGDWWNHMSCLTGYNIRTFIRLGYKADSRVQKSVELMLNTERNDSGYLCDMHEKKGKRKKSCYRGSLKVLMAFSELPELWEHKRCKQLVGYFMQRNGIFNSKLTRYVNMDMEKIVFPVIWRANNWELLLALSKMGLGSDERLKHAWQLLESREGDNGMYPLDYTPAQSPFKVGRKGELNEWVTFYVLLAKKYCGKTIQ